MSVAQRGHDLVFGDRQEDYGDPAENLMAAADFWATYLTRKYRVAVHVDAADVCAMMRLLKEVRLMHSSGHVDSLTDICGYSILQELVTTHDDPVASIQQERA